MTPSSSRASLLSPNPAPLSSNATLTARPRSRNSSAGASASHTGDEGMRPRNKKLDKTEQELGISSATNMPGISRTASPIPARHLSRSVERTGTLQNGRERERECERERPIESMERRDSSASSSKSLWKSTWASHGIAAVQEMAFSMLGGSVSKEGDARKKTLALKKDIWFEGAGGKGKFPSRWGPETKLPQQKDAGIGTGMGNAEERDAKVREKRRARVLEGRDEVVATVDSSGNYKRRTSMDQMGLRNLEEDNYALVYLHQVQPQDTLQGVVLKYHCQVDVFKKANRFWAGDSIQVRQKVFLPIDACAVKGTPCSPPSQKPTQETSLLESNSEQHDYSYSDDGTRVDLTAIERREEEEKPWTHVRWVLLDSSPSSKPVEIARIPRKILNYFPPRRRKSQTTMSSLSTPRASSDFPPLISRSSIDDSVSAPSRRTSILGTNSSQIPIVGSYLTPPSLTASNTRSRRESVGEAADRLGWLRGPGGVGTLGKNVRKPGPGSDVLNSWTSKQFPGLAIDSLPSTSVLGAERAHLGFNSTDELSTIAEGAIPNAAASEFEIYGGVSFPHMNLNGVETWVRKIATKVQVPGTPKSSAVPVAIEMLDGTGSDDGRGFELLPRSTRSSTPLDRTGRDDNESLLQIRSKGGKKSD